MTQQQSAALAAGIAKLLVRGALPGELEGFTRTDRATAAAFVAATAQKRLPGKPVVAIESIAGADAWRQMRIAIVNDDMPFLVDSVAADLASRGLSVHRLLHPIIRVERDASGQLVGLPARGGKRESIIYLEVERADAKTRRAIVDSLKGVLAAVRSAVSDWNTMQAEMRRDAAAAKSEETAALLHWFGDNHFTMLGHATFDGRGRVDTPAGLLRTVAGHVLDGGDAAEAVAWFGHPGNDVLFLKSALISPVHRHAPLDLIIVPRRDAGRAVRLSVHAGLWTSSGMGARPEDVPYLRHMLSGLQARLGFDPRGHAGKALAHAFAALPNDVLIAMDGKSLETVAVTAMSITDRPRPQLVVTGSPLARHAHVFVWMPRDAMNTSRREAVAAKLVEATLSPLLAWSVSLEEGGVALLRFTLDIADGVGLPDARALNDWLEGLLRGWDPAVEQALADRGEGSAKLAMRFLPQLPQAYRDATGPAEAADDIAQLSRLTPDHRREARIFVRAGQLRLKVAAQEAVVLSDVVPALENFGFRVIEEVPTALIGDGAGFIHDFGLAVSGGDEQRSLIGNRAAVEAAIAGVLAGDLENDRFNSLMVCCALDAQAVVLMRALYRYMRQAGMLYSLATVVDALRRAPPIVRALIGLFESLHQPDDRDAARTEEHLRAIERGLAAITAIDDDRILRQYRAVINAVLRTNMFTASASEAIAFKFDSARVPGLPAPVPWREIFVYSPRVEGIHLRAGPVARGGLRWSDRRDDFRTEILGLMKAQRVKNAVIVPTGAKGGFYPKQLPPPANREAWIAEGTESYRIFIRTLLSVTDNLVDGKAVHPAGVVCLDGDDPYFVVAADKGTATFSDVANAIALDRGFWLGDAFASGGSNGYDHKAMGITARGAWISVRRHFAEMGIDIQREPVRVAGCGDMSGDVFGNGMLLSKTLKLVAAFDHRHIFIDPDPDPAASWKERARLFKLPRSSWADYNAKLISKGGGVFPRTAKSIRLTRQMRDLLDLDAVELEPSALIAAILKADIDLMWFGGIGTYVKARNERHGEVGDRANDAHRVDAEDLRCRVVGEGANLGVTQAARIAFALAGGRINTDFIDNSAGVDCSDNEVNIKIALNAEMLAGRLGFKARNALLERMTDDVAQIVLEDNRLQTLALSMAERDAANDLPAHIRIIENFEAQGLLDRAVEGIAANDDLLRRAALDKGLTRPEFAVLLATAKLALQDAIQDTALGQDKAAVADLVAAFPPEMQKKQAKAIAAHPLRNEIIATKLANRIVNRMGIVHPFELAEEEGQPIGTVAEAFVIAEQVFGIRSIWQAIDAADIPEATRLMLLEQVAIEMRAHMADILRNAVHGRTDAAAIAVYQPLVAQLSAARDDLLPMETRRQLDGFAHRLDEAGSPRRIADDLVRLAALDGSIGLAAVSIRSKVDLIELTRAFTALGEALGIDWAQGMAMQLDPEDPWERLLAAGLARDFQAMRLDFLARTAGRAPGVATSKWLTVQQSRVAGLRATIDQARRRGVATPAMLAQVASQARAVLSL